MLGGDQAKSGMWPDERCNKFTELGLRVWAEGPGRPEELNSPAFNLVLCSCSCVVLTCLPKLAPQTLQALRVWDFFEYRVPTHPNFSRFVIARFVFVSALIL